MNEHSFRVLGYHQLLELLTTYACSEAAQNRIRSLRPTVSVEELDPFRRLCTDSLDRRQNGIELPPARFESPAEHLQRVRPERAVLLADGFIEIRALLETVYTVRRFTQHEWCAESPTLRALGRDLDDCRNLADAIDRTFEDADGHIRDHASDLLRRIRSRIRSLRDRIRSKVDDTLNDDSYAGVFQDNCITTRRSRYVVAVRREARGRLEGIVHDQSNSGSTLFVEPAHTVDMGNELEHLHLDERDEIRRILSELSHRLREHIPEIQQDFELLCQYDMAFAVSDWACKYHCLFPSLGDTLCLVQARHPLLHHQFRQEDREAELVPLDLEPPAGKNTIVVTGSNTGGKTVVLKTIGLLTMMGLTGLPIPAGEGSGIRIFSNVVADIGDEQSIEQSLSTFSGHLQQIVSILANAREGECLVLLDELGAGTDPVEGGALGAAILDELSTRPGLTFATTHLGAIKTFVHNHPKMGNASMLFNVETLRPEYNLLMGRAGASYALAVAKRLGAGAELLDNARQVMSTRERQLEDMLSALDEKQVQLNDELDTARRARVEADKMREQSGQGRDEVNRRLNASRKERRELLHQAQQEAAGLIANARREVEQVMARAERGPDKEHARQLRRKLQQRGERLDKGLAQSIDKPDKPLKIGKVQVGDRVWIDAVNDHGTITNISDSRKRVTVDVDGLAFDVPGGELSKPRNTGAEKKRERCTVTTTVEERDVAVELNLVGKRVAPALTELDRFLDSALLAGLPEIRIVHGFGTGALCDAIHERLDTVPIGSYRLGENGKDPGGGGVTVVTL